MINLLPNKYDCTFHIQRAYHTLISYRSHMLHYIHCMTIDETASRMCIVWHSYARRTIVIGWVTWNQLTCVIGLISVYGKHVVCEQYNRIMLHYIHYIQLDEISWHVWLVWYQCMVGTLYMNSTIVLCYISYTILQLDWINWYVWLVWCQCMVGMLYVYCTIVLCYITYTVIQVDEISWHIIMYCSYTTCLPYTDIIPDLI